MPRTDQCKNLSKQKKTINAHVIITRLSNHMVCLYAIPIRFTLGCEQHDDNSNDQHIDTY